MFGGSDLGQIGSTNTEGERMTDTTTTAATTTSGQSASRSMTGGAGAGASLVTDHGRTSIADSVVAKIAGIAAREMPGVHQMGSGASRAVGAIREKITSSKAAVTQGVSVEVGERQAAVDLDLVVEYGVSILDLSEGVRRNVINRVESMTGLEVTEVNITVDDIYLGDDDSDDEQAEEPRVR